MALSFKEHYGVRDSLLPKLATGFGGGFARKGLTCGVVTGAVLVIGMKFGRTTRNDEKTMADVYSKVRRFMERFENEFGSSVCYALTGCHLDDPEENKKWKTSGGKKKCSGIVEHGARMLYEVIEGSHKP